MINVLAVVTAKPGHRDALLAAWKKVIPSTRAEPGCIEYGAAVDIVGGPDFLVKFGHDAFVVIEKWISIESLQSHVVSAPYIEYLSQTKDLVASRVIHVLSSLES